MVLDKLNPICPLAMSSVTFDLVQVSSLDSKRTVNIEKTTPYFRVKTKAGYSPELSSPQEPQMPWRAIRKVIV